MIDYVIDREQRLVKTRMTGSTTFDGLVTHLSNLARDPAFDRSFNLIFTVSPDATFSVLPVEEDLQQLIKQWATRRKGTKWAFWVPFGTAHVHMQFVLGLLVQNDVQIRLFDNEATALQWLGEEESGNSTPGEVPPRREGGRQ